MAEEIKAEQRPEGQYTRMDVEHHICMQKNGKEQRVGLQCNELEMVGPSPSKADLHGWDLTVLGLSDDHPLISPHHRYGRTHRTVPVDIAAGEQQEAQEGQDRSSQD